MHYRYSCTCKYRLFPLSVRICLLKQVIIPLKTLIARKIGLVLLFSGGVFIMLIAVLRVSYVLVLKQGQIAAIWLCREDIIAILVS